VGFVVPDISSPFYALVLKGTQHRLEAAGYQVTLMDTDERPDLELAAIQSLAAQGPEGMLVCWSGADPKLLEIAIRRASVPVVFFDNFVPGVGYGSVALANEAGIRMLVDHLAQSHGHTRIGYVGGLVAQTSGQERLTGFRLGIAQNGLPTNPSLVRGGNWTHEAGSRETAALLATDLRPTAIVFVDAFTALGGLVAIRNSGLRVPEDVAVVSFDDWDAGQLLDPPLTALAQRGLQVGDLAASLLVRALEQTVAGRIDVRIPMDLVVRRSCGCNT
jgi:DNA-binding LacI/PurR family transcriptional regulator